MPERNSSESLNAAFENSPVEASKAAAISRRYFLEGKTKSEIADEFAVSRFKVARLIEWAQEIGIVRVEIAAPAAIDTDLGSQLEREFGLQGAIVLDRAGSAEASAAEGIGRLLASVMTELVEPTDVLGVGWGRTIYAAANSLASLSSCPIVQLIGATSQDDTAPTSSEVVSRLAGRSGGPSYQLHAPFFVADGDMASRLRREPVIRSTIEMFPRVTKAVLGVGSWSPAESGYMTSIPVADRDALLKRGTVADVCAVLLDEDGRSVGQAVEERTIAMTEEQLRAVPLTIVAGGGRSKSQAILSIMRSGLLDILVTDSVAATDVLRASNDSSKAGR